MRFPCAYCLRSAHEPRTPPHRRHQLDAEWQTFHWTHWPSNAEFTHLKIHPSNIKRPRPRLELASSQAKFQINSVYVFVGKQRKSIVMHYRLMWVRRKWVKGSSLLRDMQLSTSYAVLAHSAQKTPQGPGRRRPCHHSGARDAGLTFSCVNNSVIKTLYMHLFSLVQHGIDVRGRCVACRAS